jgi:hypothetical protein
MTISVTGSSKALIDTFCTVFDEVQKRNNEGGGGGGWMRDDSGCERGYFLL